MVEKRTAISIGEAIRRVMDTEFESQIEHVDITEAHGRFLAEDVVADQDVPVFNRSLYDGFAIRAEETGEEPTIFKVIAEIGAGHVFLGEVGAFQAVRIMTGAPLPEQCNAVVMFEHVETSMENGTPYIKVNEKVPYGQHVFFKGAELTAGTCVVKKGKLITPGIIALLATFGYSRVAVGKQPLVGVLATGDELLGIDEPLIPGKIRNSNSYMLLAQIERAGGKAIYLGNLPDDLEKSFAAVQQSLAKVDILITTGGVSVGDYDYMPDIYNRLDAKVLFNKVVMRPGSVTTVAKRGKQLLFGLSGNPSASFIGFELFVRPAIRRSLASQEQHLKSTTAILSEGYPPPKAFSQIIRTKISYQNAQLHVSSVGLNMSGSITSLAGADALLILPPSEERYIQGSKADILLLSEGQERAFFAN